MWSSSSLTKESLKGSIPFELMIAIAFCSSKEAMYPRVIIPGSLAFPLASLMYSTRAALPPALQIVFARSEECLAISRMHVAAFLRTKES